MAGAKCVKTNYSYIGQEPWILTTRLWEETHVLKIVGSNPSAVYWMDIFSH